MKVLILIYVIQGIYGKCFIWNWFNVLWNKDQCLFIWADLSILVFFLKDYHYGSLNTTTDTCLQRKQNYKINIPFIQQNFVKSNVAFSLFVDIIIWLPIWVFCCRYCILCLVLLFLLLLVLLLRVSFFYCQEKVHCLYLCQVYHLRKMLFSLKVL